MSRPIQILMVEDSSDDAELILRELNRAPFKFDVRRVETEDDFLAALNSNIQLILSDFAMPQFSGLRALELLKKRPEFEIPFIIISGTIGEETAVKAMQQGASDYLLKDRIARLVPAVTRALDAANERAERRRYEAQFIEAQKMEVVGQLAAGVAHDFNNVLAVIMGYADLIQKDLAPVHPLQKFVDEIRQASRRATGLTQQLLIFSRKQSVQPVELDLNEVIRGMEKMLRQLINENIEMTVRCEEDLPHVKADSGYLWQVLMNLVVNARDAMPNGGKLAIKTGSTAIAPGDPRTESGLPPGHYVTLGVTDSGVGMSDEVKSRLFEAFFTTKVAGKGTGLGLVTCQTITKQSGGHIEVASELGQGSTFSVYLPSVERSTPTATSRPPKTGRVRLGTETLLVVEDEPSLRNLAQSVLKARGYHVLTAANGQDALRVVRENQGQPVRLVITDVIMPRMGGKVMAEWLKVSHPDLKILFTSGYSEDAIAHQGAMEKGVAFLPKPYTPSTLARKVRELLDESSSPIAP